MKLKRMKGLALCAGLLLASAACGSERDVGAAVKIAIVKADDVRGASENWKRFIAISRDKGVKVSCGVICQSLAQASVDYEEWLSAEERIGGVEFWNHGWDHRRWEEGGEMLFEFSGSGFAHQSKHLAMSQAALKKAISRAPVVFGAPFNKMDEETARALRENPEIKLLFCYRDPEIGGVAAALMPFRGEPDGTGKPNVAKFAREYEEKKDEVTFAAVQFHPNSFSEERHFSDYAKTLDILLEDGWTFMLPREYLAWLNRANAEQQ